MKFESSPSLSIRSVPSDRTHGRCRHILDGLVQFPPIVHILINDSGLLSRVVIRIVLPLGSLNEVTPTVHLSLSCHYSSLSMSPRLEHH